MGVAELMAVDADDDCRVTHEDGEVPCAELGLPGQFRDVVRDCEFEERSENEIRDKKLLIKTGIMLTVVILGFFLHPVIHMDPVWVAISGAIVIFALDNHHDLEE